MVGADAVSIPMSRAPPSRTDSSKPLTVHPYRPAQFLKGRGAGGKKAQSGELEAIRAASTAKHVLYCSECQAGRGPLAAAS